MKAIDRYLISERCEPSLILVNQKFLYAFCGFRLYETFINSMKDVIESKKKILGNYKL